MATTTMTRTGWVVRNAQGRVVVIFAGADAKDAAEQWAARGYDVATANV
jgi:hypothetical protein